MLLLLIKRQWMWFKFCKALGLVYTSSYCRTKSNIVKFGNGTAERHFDLYVEPVSNSTDLIVIYGANIHAKFGGKFVRSNKMAPVHEQK